MMILSRALDVIAGFCFVIFFWKYWEQLIVDERLAPEYLVGMFISVVTPIVVSFL